MILSRRMPAKDVRAWITALLLSISVAVAVTYTVSRLSHVYTASAYLIATSNNGIGIDDSSGDAMSVAQLLLTDDALAVIDRQFHPYSALASHLFSQWTEERLRSELVLANSYPHTEARGAIGVFYSGSNRETVLGITNAITQSLCQPQEISTLSIPPVDPQSTVTDRVQGSEVAAVRAEPVPEAGPDPDLPVAAEGEANAKLREQVDAARRTEQDLVAQRRSVSDSLASIQVEKDRLTEYHGREMAEEAHKTAQSAQVSPADSKRATLQSSLSTSRKSLATLRDRYTEDYPDVIAARERVQQLELELSQLPRDSAPTLRAEPNRKSEIPERLVALDRLEAPLRANLRELNRQLALTSGDVGKLKREMVRVPARRRAMRDAPEPSIKEPAALVATPGPAPRPVARQNPMRKSSRFTILKQSEIQSSEQILGSGAAAAIGTAAGLTVGFAFLGIRRLLTRKSGLEASFG